MSAISIQKTRLNVGRSEITYDGVAREHSDNLRKFAEDINCRIGHLFDVPLQAEISISERLGEAREMFLKGERCDYTGYDLPRGWELRKADDHYIFGIQKKGAFLDVREEQRELKARFYSADYDFGVLRHGVIDILQLGTTSLLVHSVALEKDGLGILFVAESGSGKSTLHAQLINSGYKFNLITEGYSLVSEGRLFQVKTSGLLRKGALRYLNMDMRSDQEIEFRNYIGTLDAVKKIDIVILPSFNLNEEYSASREKVKVKPIYRDWALQAHAIDKEVMIAEKSKHLAFIPKDGLRLRYSTDAKKTTLLFDDILRNLVRT